MSGESIMYRVGKSSGASVAAIVDAFADKKITLVEGLNMAAKIGGCGYLAYAEHNAIGSAFVDGLSEEEAEQLKEGFSEGFDPGNKRGETKVEEYFELAFAITAAVSGIVCKAKVGEAA